MITHFSTIFLHLSWMVVRQKGMDTPQARCMEVSGMASAWQECDLLNNQKLKQAALS